MTEMRLEDGNRSHLTSIADCPSAVCAKEGKELFPNELAVVLEANGSCETLAVGAGETSRAGERLQKHISSPLKELGAI